MFTTYTLRNVTGTGHEYIKCQGLRDDILEPNNHRMVRTGGEIGIIGEIADSDYWTCRNPWNYQKYGNYWNHALIMCIIGRPNIQTGSKSVREFFEK